MNVIFVKFGTKYNADHVNRLARKLEDVGRLYCYTDDSEGVDDRLVECVEPVGPKLKGVWNKLTLFAPFFPIQNETLYVDLDTTVNYLPITAIANHRHQYGGIGEKLHLIHNPQKTKMIRASNYDVDINSSVMLFDNRTDGIHEIWNHFNTY